VTRSPVDDRPSELERAIADTVREHAAEWVPDAASSHVRLRRLVERPRAVLYAVCVGHDDGPQILAKVRRGQPDGEGPLRAGARPRLVDGALPVAEQTTLEYEGLRQIRAMVGGAHPVFAAVRPFGVLVPQHTVLMEYVRASTLRQQLVRDSRLAPPRLRSRRRDDDRVWQDVGAWLSTFQRAMRKQGLAERQATREDVVDRFAAYAEWLTATLGADTVGDGVHRGADLARDLLPARLPMAVGHGDFAPRNVFLRDDGRLAVFDPMPRWVVPRYEDLCRFLVAVRLQGIQLHTRGLAYAERELDRREQGVLDGFRAGSELPLRQLRCYQLLITLDKWSALADRTPAGWRRRVHDTAMEAASGYLRREVQRLLRHIEADAG
jgi:hypothetical protein